MLIISRDWVGATYSKKLNQMDIVRDPDPPSRFGGVFLPLQQSRYISTRQCPLLLCAQEETLRDQRKAGQAASPRIININGSDVSPMVMTTMMASTPSIVMTSATVMAPAMDLDD